MLKSTSAKISEKFDGQRFDVAATALFEELSRKKIKAIIDSGGAYINKKRVNIAKITVKVGDKIELFWEDKNAKNEKDNDNNEFESRVNNNKNMLVFENENFFIINKPAGVASQATLTSSKNHILQMLSDNDSKKFNLNSMFLVHRLDKDTSGLMIIAKNKIMQNKFEDLFRNKKIQKTYDALCFYTPKKLEGVISFSIAKDKSRKNCYLAVINPNSRIQDAKYAETSYSVQKIYNNGEISHIICFPKTGRTHQIRVHLSAIGCPILGDKTYSQNIYGNRFTQVALRQMLHARSLNFELNGEKFDFSISLPDDFQRVLKNFENVK